MSIPAFDEGVYANRSVLVLYTNKQTPVRYNRPSIAIFRVHAAANKFPVLALLENDCLTAAHFTHAQMQALIWVCAALPAATRRHCGRTACL